MCPTILLIVFSHSLAGSDNATGFTLVDAFRTVLSYLLTGSLNREISKRQVDDTPIQPDLQHPPSASKIPESPSLFVVKTPAGSRATRKERNGMSLFDSSRTR